MRKASVYISLLFLVVGAMIYLLGGITYAFDLGPTEIRVYPAYFFFLVGLSILIRDWWRTKQTH